MEQVFSDENLMLYIQNFCNPRTVFVLYKTHRWFRVKNKLPLKVRSWCFWKMGGNLFDMEVIKDGLEKYGTSNLVCSWLLDLAFSRNNKELAKFMVSLSKNKIPLYHFRDIIEKHKEKIPTLLDKEDIDCLETNSNVRF